MIEESVLINGVCINVYFYYEPGEPMTWWEPGYPEEYEIAQATIDGVGLDIELDEKAVAMLTEELIKIREDNDHEYL